MKKTKEVATEIIKINPTEYGLTDQTAKNISDQFKPMLDKMVELEKEFNEVVSLPIEDKETSKKAKEVRLKYVKVRTGTAEIHKSQKSFYLNGGRFVDGWKNAQLFASEGKESKLAEIENYYENLEREKIEKLQSERIELISPYLEDTSNIDFGNMKDDVWEAYFSAKKTAHNDRLEAEKKAEEDRIAKEKAEAERIRLQEIENAKLKAEALKKEKELEAERNAKLKAEQEAKAKLEAQQKEAEAKRKAEQEKHEAEKRKIEIENQKKLKAEQDKKAKLEAELKAKKDAELKAEKLRLQKIADEKAEAERLAKAPIKEQLKKWVGSFDIADASVKNKTSEDIKSKFIAFKNWAVSEIDKM